MSTTNAERLSALRAQLKLARAANTKAVETELREEAEREGAAERQRQRRVRERREAKARAAAAKASGTLFVDPTSLKETAGEAEERGRAGGKRKEREAGEEAECSGDGSVRGTSHRMDGDDWAVRAYEKRLKLLHKDGKEGGTESQKGENVERMVNELEETKRRRRLFSRRRPFHEDNIDISFINERNRKFNDKLARTFDEQTAISRENLERGTALPDE